MTETTESLVMLDQLLQDFAVKNPREHKRIKFVNKNLLELELIERKLEAYFVANLVPEELVQLNANLDGVVGESRICEYLLALIKHGEERIDRHVELFREICNVLRQLRENGSEPSVIQDALEKCSLMVYDSFHFLCDVKRVAREVASIYQVPYYYETNEGTIRLRSSLLSTYKNLNTIIDDLVTLNEALWYMRHYSTLVNM